MLKKIFWHYQHNFFTGNTEYFCDLNLVNAITLTAGGKQALLSPTGTEKCYSTTNALPKLPNCRLPVNLSLILKIEEGEFFPVAGTDIQG